MYRGPDSLPKSFTILQNPQNRSKSFKPHRAAECLWAALQHIWFLTTPSFTNDKLILMSYSHFPCNTSLTCMPLSNIKQACRQCRIRILQPKAPYPTTSRICRIRGLGSNLYPTHPSPVSYTSKPRILHIQAPYPTLVECAAWGTTWRDVTTWTNKNNWTKQKLARSKERCNSPLAHTTPPGRSQCQKGFPTKFVMV